MINILTDRQKKKKKTNKQTSDKYTRIQKTVLLFKLSQKITISKALLYISEDHDRPTPSQGKNHKKEKEKRKEKVKRGEERNNGGSGT